MWIWLLAAFLIIGTWLGRLLPRVAALAEDPASRSSPSCIVVGWHRLPPPPRGAEGARPRARAAQAGGAAGRSTPGPIAAPRSWSSRSQFQRGLAALKRAALGAGGRRQRALRAALVHDRRPARRRQDDGAPALGPRLPVPRPGSGGGMRGVGGTRNCDWWFTNEAILLDTAGRYTTEADDHDEWIAFLDMLQVPLGEADQRRPRRRQRHRPDRGDRGADRRDGQAPARAHRRDDDAPADGRPRLRRFTKMDLVAGFAEFWGDLRKSERAQIWGATLPLDGRGQAGRRRKAFDEEFDALVETLHARAVAPRRARAQPGDARSASTSSRSSSRPLKQQPLGLRRRALRSRTRSRRRRSSAASTSRAARRRAAPSTASSAG